MNSDTALGGQFTFSNNRTGLVMSFRGNGKVTLVGDAAFSFHQNSVVAWRGITIEGNDNNYLSAVGIFENAKFVMHSGAIINNKKTETGFGGIGGGVFIDYYYYNDTTPEFINIGGTIKGNNVVINGKGKNIYYRKTYSLEYYVDEDIIGTPISTSILGSPWIADN